MKRGLPLLPTLLTALMLPILLGLGVWQIERRAWKAELLATLVVAQRGPPLDVEALAGGGDLSFRRLRVRCDPAPALPTVTGGESRAGRGGSLLLVPCRHAGPATRLSVVAGWQARPRPVAAIALVAPVTGFLVRDRDKASYLLVADEPPPGLAPAAQPSLDDIPDNHLQYAITWFSFALILAVIYGITVQRWRRARAAAS